VQDPRFESPRGPGGEPIELAASARRTLAVVLLLVAAAFTDVPLVIAGVYLWRLGQQAIEAGRFPPPGVTPIRPMPVLTGEPSSAPTHRLPRAPWLLGAVRRTPRNGLG
jgi:hypothetical protein